MDLSLTRRRQSALLAVLAGFVAFSASQVRMAEAAAEVSLEYQVKAAFLCNFAKFIDWPAEAFSGPDEPIVIGVLGENPFGKALETAAQGQALNGHPLTVREFHSIDEVTTCHLLFVSQSEEPLVQDILTRLQGAKVLTVSDMERFTELGGMIRFVSRDKKIRFEINQQAAQQAELKISSKLLGLAVSR